MGSVNMQLYTVKNEILLFEVQTLFLNSSHNGKKHV